MSEQPILLIFRFLAERDLIAPERRHALSDRCRDAEVAVFRDGSSGVVYLDPAFRGKREEYYTVKPVPSNPYPRNDMEQADSARRHAYLEAYAAGQRWVDFGCGPGHQIRMSSRLAADTLGIELNAANVESLRRDGFRAEQDMAAVAGFGPDVVSLFHVLEHLPDPVGLLSALHGMARPNATLIVEVPHAGDSLLDRSEAFRRFTLWSEHLVLHTRQSLETTIAASGWRVTELLGVQRYPVWNHLEWLAGGRPTGLKATAADRTAGELARAYEAFLAARGATDTLLAIARA